MCAHTDPKGVGADRGRRAGGAGPTYAGPAPARNRPTTGPCGAESLRETRRAGQMIDTAEFRRVIGHFATGVTVVTTLRDDGRPCGLTASAVCSVSLDPTLVLVCVEKAAASHGCIEQSGVFAVNVLADGKGETLARRFAG